MKAHEQVTYLDALIWTPAPWKSIVRALSSTVRKSPALLDMYMSLAQSTGEGPRMAALV